MADSNKKVPMLEITRPDSHGPKMHCLVGMGHALSDEFDGAEEGERIIFTMRYMTEQEVKDLPDFEGW